MLRLNIAERTLHRRIASGKLQKRFRQNGQIEVWIAAEPRGSPTDNESDTDRQEQAERALALVERVNLAVNQQVEPLLRELRAANETIREQTEELGRLRTELATRTPTAIVSDNDSHLDLAPVRTWWQRLLWGC